MFISILKNRSTTKGLKLKNDSEMSFWTSRMVKPVNQWFSGDAESHWKYQQSFVYSSFLIGITQNLESFLDRARTFH